MKGVRNGQSSGDGFGVAYSVIRFLRGPRVTLQPRAFYAGHRPFLGLTLSITLTNENVNHTKW